MYYGIEQSTDLRCKKTVIKKFTRKDALLKWLDVGERFTYSNPEIARNHHHTFRAGYQLAGRINKKHDIFTLPGGFTDLLALYIRNFGKKVMGVK